MTKTIKLYLKQNYVLLKTILILFLNIFSFSGYSQDLPSYPTIPSDAKIEHADPVYQDFTTDLGARKGEGQINVNFGYQNLSKNHHVLLSQLELEYAPVDNLGLELLLPYSIYINNHLSLVERPENRLEFFQWAAQYTFYKSASKGISMAFGYRNSFEIASPEPKLNRGDGFDLKAITYHPFLTFAKNIQDQYFFTVSGGPEVSQDLEKKDFELAGYLNTAFHYGFSDKGNYLGVEFNTIKEEGSFEMYIRPQIIMQIGQSFNLGAAIGLPVWVKDTQWSGFLRLAYEFD